MNAVYFSVFTKPWKMLPAAELAQKVRGMGFDGIEFPLRDGYQVEPARAEVELPRLVHNLQDYGVQVFSVATDLEERRFAALQAAGIPFLRTMVPIHQELGYEQSELAFQRTLDQVIPWCERYGVRVIVQEHYGHHVSSALGLWRLLQGRDPRHVGAVWDAAHDALAGLEPEYGLELLWPMLAMVNLKNAFYRRVNGPESDVARYDRYFTSGPQGMASWRRALAYLARRRYRGVLCLTAEYSEESLVDRLAQEDVHYARSLWTEVLSPPVLEQERA